MSKLIKIILITAYCTLVFQYLKSFFIFNHEILLDIEYLVKPPGAAKKLERELKRFMRHPNSSIPPYIKPERLPTDLKFILKWTNAFGHYSSSVLRNGQDAFIDHKCSYYNCFLTNDRSLLLDIRHFDAILFDVENNWDFHPFFRSPHQIYIFVASESSANYPLCHPHYDNYYNLTWTYKLDSDIRWTYVTIQDKNGTVVGPKINMTWKDDMGPISDEVKRKLKTKKVAAAWFVSHCNAKSQRHNVSTHIQWELAHYGYEVDIYGWCGKFTCPRDRLEDCLDLLEKKYYFYLAFENSFCEDYVTEKILYPLLHYTVPIVFGGANYSRFLPPRSYINARENDAKTIATLIHEAIEISDIYHKYFRWHNHYVYKESPKISDICTLCKMVNEYKKPQSKKHFRKWWNDDMKNDCKHYFKHSKHT